MDRRRAPWRTLAVATTVLLTGCGIFPVDRSGDCSIRPADSPVEVLTEPDVPEAPKGRWNLTLDVTNTLDESVRVTVRFDRRLALDIDVPGSTPRCAHQPVHRYRYRLPGDATTVTVRTDDGQRDSTRVDQSGGKRWLVVQLQACCPLEIDLWDSRPLWG